MMMEFLRIHRQCLEMALLLTGGDAENNGYMIKNSQEETE